MHVTGPGHVAVGATFPLRLFWGTSSDGFNPILPGIRYYGAALVDGVSGLGVTDLGQTAFIPLSITRSVGQDDVADALEPNAMRTLVVEPGESLQHVFIDVPADVSTLSISTAQSGGSVRNMSFVCRARRFPGAFVGNSNCRGAIGGRCRVAVGTGRCNREQTSDSSSDCRPLVHRCVEHRHARSDVRAERASQSRQRKRSRTHTRQLLQPQRSGHGVFISQASGQQVVDWYTYLEDGTPTWYLAQNTAPITGAGTWTSTLYRATWNGSSGSPTPVGEVIVTATSADHAMFSWRLNGQVGSEAIALLASPECVNANGNVNLNGEWYAPAQSGYGFDALVLPSQQFDAFYMYDETGNPRWVVGGNGPFAASSTVPMLQSTGFCPLCAYRAYTTQPAGNMTVKYATPRRSADDGDHAESAADGNLEHQSADHAA